MNENGNFTQNEFSDLCDQIDALSESTGIGDARMAEINRAKSHKVQFILENGAVCNEKVSPRLYKFIRYLLRRNRN